MTDRLRHRTRLVGRAVPDDPAHIPWPRFLDEVVEAGYEWIELDPYGDPGIAERVHREDLSSAEAVRRGVTVEPARGVPATEPALEALSGVDADLVAIVEQDLYPCDPAVPFPLAQRTRRHLGGCGLYSRPRET
jgi:hypothetical protein